VLERERKRERERERERENETYKDKIQGGGTDSLGLKPSIT
jgi:hypothetical protein